MSSKAQLLKDLRLIKPHRKLSPLVEGRGPHAGRLSQRASRARQFLRVVQGSRSAFVKKIPNAGTHLPNQLKGQINYVNGKSQALFGNGFVCDEGQKVLPQDEVEALIEDWSDGWRGQTKNGHTTHLVVSFPDHVDAKRALNIAREWGYEMFESREHVDDEWDYFASLHTDTANNHVHFIVNNRGKENNGWFFMAKDHEFNYDMFRDRLVAIAEEYGVFLDNTKRLERGLVRYAPSSGEWREAKAQGIEPLGRIPHPGALDAAKAKLAEYAVVYRSLATAAQVIDYGDIAMMLSSAADDLSALRPIRVKGDITVDISALNQPSETQEAILDWAADNAEAIDELDPVEKQELQDQIKQTLDHLEKVQDPAYQASAAAEMEAKDASVSLYRADAFTSMLGDQDAIETRAAEYLAQTNTPEDTQIKIADFMKRENLATFMVTGETQDIHRDTGAAFEQAFNDLSSETLDDTRKRLLGVVNEFKQAGFSTGDLMTKITKGAANGLDEHHQLKADFEVILTKEGLDGGDIQDMNKASAILSGLYNRFETAISQTYNQQIQLDLTALQETSNHVAERMHSTGRVMFEDFASSKAYAEAMVAYLGKEQIEELALGKVEVLDSITRSVTDQRAIANGLFQLIDKHDLDIDENIIKEGREHYGPDFSFDDGHSL